MKKTIVLTGTLLLLAASVEAGDLFGGSLKPTPSVTLFGQKLSWPIPSLCVGAKAGVLPDAGISPKEGLQIAVTAILAIFLRHGVAKSQTASEAAIKAASKPAPAPALKKRVIKKA